MKNGAGSADDPGPVQPARVAEVDDQSDAQSRCFQVVQHLRFFADSDLIDRLQFDEDSLKANEVGAECLFQHTLLELDVKRYLPVERNAAVTEFELHRLLVHA